MQRYALSISLLLLAAAPICKAADFCVTTPQQFQDALLQASTNGQDDHIKVRKGTYDVSSIGSTSYGVSLRYAGYSDPASDLRITGGWVSEGRLICAYQSGFSSQLTGGALNPSGNPVGPLLMIALGASRSGGSGNIEVERLYLYQHEDIFSADPSSDCGAGLRIQEVNPGYTDTGSITVHHNRFVWNEARYGAGLCIEAPNAISVNVSHNLFMENYATSAAGAAWIWTEEAENVSIINNTVLRNEAQAWIGGIKVRGHAAETWVANNILWDNRSPSLKLGAYIANATFFLNNDYDTMSTNGTLAASSGNRQVEPQFQNCGTFCFYYKVLEPTSPLVDAGYPGGYWQVPALDLAYKDRVAGSDIDMGAYETQNPE